MENPLFPLQVWNSREWRDKASSLLGDWKQLHFQKVQFSPIPLGKVSLLQSHSVQITGIKTKGSWAVETQAVNVCHSYGTDNSGSQAWFQHCWLLGHNIQQSMLHLLFKLDVTSNYVRSKVSLEMAIDSLMTVRPSPSIAMFIHPTSFTSFKILFISLLTPSRHQPRYNSIHTLKVPMTLDHSVEESISFCIIFSLLCLFWALKLAGQSVVSSSESLRILEMQVLT